MGSASILPAKRSVTRINKSSTSCNEKVYPVFKSNAPTSLSATLEIFWCQVTRNRCFQKYRETYGIKDVIFFTFREIMKLLLVCTNVPRRSRRAPLWADRWPRGAAPPTTRRTSRICRPRPPCSTPSMIRETVSPTTSTMFYTRPAHHALYTTWLSWCPRPPCSTPSMIRETVSPTTPTMFYTRPAHHALHTAWLTWRPRPPCSTPSMLTCRAPFAHQVLHPAD